MLYSFSYVSPVIQEQRLRSRINELHSQMLDFNRRISPAKRDEAFHQREIRGKRGHLAKTVAETALNLIGCASCVAWPLLFPLFIYSAEGRTGFFWFIAIVCSLTSLYIVAKVSSDVSRDLRRRCVKMYDRVKRTLTSVSDSARNTAKRAWNVLANVRVLVLAFFVCVGSAVAASWNDWTNIFLYGMILSVGFLSGLCASHATRHSDGLLPVTGKKTVISSTAAHFSAKGQFHHICYQDMGCSPQLRRRSPPPTYQEALRESGEILEFSPAGLYRHPVYDGEHFL